MKKQRVLIIGGNGFVGSNLAHALAPHHSVFCTVRSDFTPLKNVTYLPYRNIADKDLANNLMKKIEPEVVIYAIGSNDPIKAEADVIGTQYLHLSGATMALAASEPIKAKYILISADSVFSGQHGNFSESDTALPNYQIGKAKMGAENYVRSRSSDHLIIRCAPLLGRGPTDHPSWIDRLRENEILKKKSPLSKKSLHNPVHISVLSNLIQKCMEEDIKNKTFHVGGLTKVSPHDLAMRIFKAFDLDTGLIECSDLEARSEPTDYSLNFSQTLRTLQGKPLSLDQSIEALK